MKVEFCWSIYDSFGFITGHLVGFFFDRHLLYYASSTINLVFEVHGRSAQGKQY